MQVRYSNKIKEQIISLMEEEQGYSVSDICTVIGISRKTFYRWKKTIPDFTQELEEVADRNRSALIESARIAVKKRLEGYRTTTIRTKYVQDENGEWVAKERTVLEKDCPPDYRLIKIILENDETAQQNFKETEETKDKVSPALSQIIAPSKEDALAIEQFLTTMKVRNNNLPALNNISPIVVSCTGNPNS